MFIHCENKNCKYHCSNTCMLEDMEGKMVSISDTGVCENFEPNPNVDRPIAATVDVNQCECVYCGRKFIGDSEDTSCSVVTCPHCNKKMYLYKVVEYVCFSID